MSSPVNVIVSEASQDNGAGPFPFFSFAIVGIPLLIGTTVIGVVLGPRLLRNARPAHLPPDLGRYAETLGTSYALTDGFYRLRVRTRSPLVGRPISSLAGDFRGVRKVLTLAVSFLQPQCRN